MKTTPPLRSIATLATLATATLLAGCSNYYPQPSEDAVYYFLASARLGGKMRVCWPAGQQYAVGITEADAKLQTELGRIRYLWSYGAEWPRDDPRWHDAKAVEEHAEELAKLADEGADARQEALEAVGKAIDKLPKDLPFADDAAREAFKQRLWGALGESREGIAGLEGFLDMRLRLFEKVHESATLLDPAAAGLRFTDAAVQREVDALYDALAARVVTARELFFDYASARMPQIRLLIAKIDKRKQREQYNLLDNERSYIRSAIEGDQRELRELIKAEEKELAKCEEAEKPKSTEIAFHKHRIETLKAELAHVTERGAAIMKPQS